MPQRSYSVSQALAGTHQYHQGMNTSTTAMPSNRHRRRRRRPTSSFHIQAPPLEGTLAREMRNAIPKLERILAGELSLQTLPLCMELLQNWVTTSAKSSDGDDVSHMSKENNQQQLIPRSMTRSKLSRWFLESFSRKKPAVFPSRQDISDSDSAASPAWSSTSSSLPQPVLLPKGEMDDDDDEEEEEELGTLSITPSSTATSLGDPFPIEQNPGAANTENNSSSNDAMHIAVVRSMPRATTTISGFLNKLGLSVMKKVNTVIPSAAAAAAAAAAVVEPDTNAAAAAAAAIFHPPILQPPPEVYDRYNSSNNHHPNKSAVTLASTISVQSSAGAQKKHLISSWEDEEIWRPRGDDKVIPRKPVQHSKTDMDMLREQSVPYIKMGMSRQQNNSSKSHGRQASSSSASSSPVARRHHGTKPTTFYDLQQWHQLFHDQQQNPDKLEANLHRVTAALFRMIELNHQDGFFEYDEDAFSGSPMLHLRDKLFDIQPLTTPDDIFDQIAYVFECGELTSEHAILTYIYVERMLRKSGQALCDINWRFILLAGMLLAVKVWDDCAVYNSDFVQIFPELDIPLVNKIERHFLRAIDYEVGCTCANFAATYFDLRDAAVLLARRK